CPTTEGVPLVSRHPVAASPAALDLLPRMLGTPIAEMQTGQGFLDMVRLNFLAREAEPSRGRRRPSRRTRRALRVDLSEAPSPLNKRVLNRIFVSKKANSDAKAHTPPNYLGKLSVDQRRVLQIPESFLGPLQTPIKSEAFSAFLKDRHHI